MNIYEIEAALRRYEEAVAEILRLWEGRQSLSRADARAAVRALKPHPRRRESKVGVGMKVRRATR